MESDAVIRPTVRAVISRDQHILVQVKKSDAGKRYLTLPGGRQEFGETMQECLVRECLEEIGTAPNVADLLHVADVFRHRASGTRHLLEVLFRCEVPLHYAPSLGSHPDKRQVATIWADPIKLGSEFLPRYDLALTDQDAPVHLGRLDCVVP